MALINGTNAHPLAATAGILGGIVAMPFAVAGTAVVGALGTVAAAVPTLGLGAVPGALITVGATVTTAFTSPFSIGSKIYNKCVEGTGDEISFGAAILDKTIDKVAVDVFDNFKEVVDM